MKRVPSSFFVGVISIFLIGIFWHEVQAPENVGEDMRRDAVMEKTALDLPKGEIKVVPEEKPVIRLVDNAVSFTVQAPGGQWKNPRYQDGCEEASMLMALRWVKGEKITNPQKELDEISREMERHLGTFYDTSMADTFSFAKSRLSEGGVSLVNGVTVQKMIDALLGGKILVISANGRLLKNSHFTAPGPLYHMLVVRGYDPEMKEFITNDPGTSFGNGYRYPEEVLFSAMQNYETGRDTKRYSDQKSMMVFGKK